MMTDDRETLIELRKRDDKIAALTIERDDAQARVRELEATTTAATIRDVHKALGATVGQSVVTRAVEVMGDLVEARRLRDSALGRVVDLEIKAATAAHPGQARTADLAASAVQILRDAVLSDDQSDDIEDLAKMAADQITAVRAALRWEGEGSCGTLVEHARDVRALLDEAPSQVFAIRHTVKVETDHGLTYAEVDIGRITDPEFLALPMGVRLGMVVLRA